MKTPWFMHCHEGVNTLVGSFPTPYGVYVRSWKEGVCNVVFYPLDPRFPFGRSRVVDTVGRYRDEEFREEDPQNSMEAKIDADVVSHLKMAMERAYADRYGQGPVSEDEALIGTLRDVAAGPASSHVTSTCTKAANRLEQLTAGK